MVFGKPQLYLTIGLLLSQVSKEIIFLFREIVLSLQKNQQENHEIKLFTNHLFVLAVVPMHDTVSPEPRFPISLS